MQHYPVPAYALDEFEVGGGVKGPDFPDVDTFSADLPAADISDAGSLPDTSVDIPPASIDVPSGSVDVPSVDLSGKGPDMPSVGGDVSGELPSASLDASGSLPSGEVDVSAPSVSGAVDVPSVDVKKPKKSLFGGIFGSSKGKMDVEVSWEDGCCAWLDMVARSSEAFFSCCPSLFLLRCIIPKTRNLTNAMVLVHRFFFLELFT